MKDESSWHNDLIIYYEQVPSWQHYRISKIMDIIIQINSKSILDTEKGIWKRMYYVEMWVKGVCVQFLFALVTLEILEVLDKFNLDM
jgi:hypothetical protein